MPGMSGLEVLAEIRRDSRTKDTIVIMLTANNMMDDASKVLANGADDYIPKPFDGDDLGQRITDIYKALNGRHEAPASHAKEAMGLSL